MLLTETEFKVSILESRGVSRFPEYGEGKREVKLGPQLGSVEDPAAPVQRMLGGLYPRQECPGWARRLPGRGVPIRGCLAACSV